MRDLVADVEYSERYGYTEPISRLQSRAAPCDLDDDDYRMIARLAAGGTVGAELRYYKSADWEADERFPTSRRQEHSSPDGKVRRRRRYEAAARRAQERFEEEQRDRQIKREGQADIEWAAEAKRIERAAEAARMRIAEKKRHEVERRSLSSEQIEEWEEAHRQWVKRMWSIAAG